MKKNKKSSEKEIQPFITYFEVKGLFGYKDIRIDFNKNITITAAENGNGKTTLLNIFYAILSGDINLLKKYNFESITIKFQDEKEPITLNNEDLYESDHDFAHEYNNLERNRSYHRLKAILIEDFGEEGFFEIINIVKEYKSFNRKNFQLICKKLEDKGFPSFSISIIRDIHYYAGIKNNKLINIRKKVSDNNLSVLYFPTYRRIESYAIDDSDNDDEEDQRYYRLKRRYQRTSKWDKNRLMNFGLDDVGSKLQDICDDITRITLRTYSEIGRSILDDLLISNPRKDANEQINPETLQFVLSRLEKGDDATVNKINNLIESGDIKKPENSALASLLVQLNEIYKKTEKNEKAIESFATVINSYWEINTPREKEFIFDKANVKTYVKNLITSKRLELNSLSSGEKQIFSIFARLYLNTDKNYIILIDEPELSLSLDWQRKFLVDMTNSPSCNQLFAITHSPFIFENELDKYAKPFSIKNNEIKE